MHGALPDGYIHNLLNGGVIQAEHPDVRACSLDLPIEGSRLWQMSGATHLKDGFKHGLYLEQYCWNAVDLAAGGEYTLSPGCTYMVQLQAKLNLTPALSGYANPTSSSGRIDLFVRVLGEGSTQINQIPAGYSGELYQLITPQSFPVTIRPGQIMSQLRLYDGPRHYLQGHQLEVLDQQYGLTARKNGKSKSVLSQDGLTLHLDLKRRPACLVANHIKRPIPYHLRGELDSRIFYREKVLDMHGNLHLEPGEMALVASIEALRIHPRYCGEMVPYNDGMGELRSHYAGFFDPGWGWEDDDPAVGGVAVLELCNLSKEAIILAHGQEITQMRFEELLEVPENPYKMAKGREASHFVHQQGVLLPKFFAPWQNSGR